MKDEAIAAEFTAALREFLTKRGYTHILSLGIDPNELNDVNEPETGRENYWLEPIKPGDERLNDTTKHPIQEIKDSKVSDMAASEEDILFMVRVPLVDYNDYLAKR